MKRWVAFLLALTLLLSGTAALAERRDVKSVKPDSAAALRTPEPEPEPMPASVPAPQASFTLCGIEYTLGELQDAPPYLPENRLDGLPGHAITFNYQSGENDEEGNMALFRGCYLLVPEVSDGPKGGQVYSNGGNLENPYTLYFGLSEGVNLSDCTLAVPTDGSELFIQLGEDTPMPTIEPTAKPAPTPDVTPAPEPTPLPMAVAGSEGASLRDVVLIPFEGQQIAGCLGSVGYDPQREKMGVSFYSQGLQDHIKMQPTDGGFSIVVPVQATIHIDGAELKPVDGTFNQNEAMWFFDTDQAPDTVTFYPYGGETDPSIHTAVDAATGRRIGQAAPVQTPSGAAAPAAEPEPTPAPTAEPTPEPTLEPTPEPTEEPKPIIADWDQDDVSALIAQLAEEAADPWVKAIYEAGGSSFSLNDGIFTFYLRAFDPRLDELGDYDADPEAWTQGLLENAFISLMDAELVLAEAGPDDASLSAMKKAVQAQAETSKAAFDKKAVRVALANHLLPKPAESIKTADDLGELDPYYVQLVDAVAGNASEPTGYAPLFWAQPSQSLNVTGGPHALVLNCKGADSAKLLDDAVAKTLDAMKQRYQANQLDGYTIEEALLAQLVKAANSVRDNGGTAHSFTLDTDALYQNDDFGEDYRAYVDAYKYKDALEALIEEVQHLPDAQPQAFPKSGRISGSKGGTKVIISAPDDGDGRYVQMRDSDTDEVKVDMFIRSGSSATVYVPKGMYYLMVAAGSEWYGVEGLFGDDGRYSQTSETEILSSNYYHTIKLQTVSDGNMSSYGADMSDFF